MSRKTSAPPGRVPLLGIAALALAGCIEELPSGEHGTLRYFGEVNGDAPLPMLPPISDRDGNAYVLYGAPNRTTELDAYAGSAHGGWPGGCSILRNQNITLGARAWVGAATSRAWYWAGEGLVEMSGRTGSCRVVLPNDPATNVSLVFLGVVPRVYETPSRTFLHALIRGGSDVVHVTVDLDRDDYGDTRPFQPENASDIRVLGTGADPKRNIGYMLVSYELDGARVLDGIHLDRNNREIGRTRIGNISGELADSLGHGAIHGNLETADGNLVAGFVGETGDVILFDRGDGTVRTVPEMTTRGVHRWGSQLYAVGESGGDPVIATINSDASFGPPVIWEASVRAASRLEGVVSVLDDRREPRQVVGWENPVSAPSEHPFVQPWSLHPYADNTSVWLIAGPSFDVAGIPRTSIAYGPVGISYP